MALIYMFNARTGIVERYNRTDGEPMPYNVGGTLTVGEFTNATAANTIWSDTDTMRAFNSTRSLFQNPISVRVGFLNIDETPKSSGDFYPAGVSFLMAPLGGTVQQLLAAANNSGEWTTVEQRGNDVYADLSYAPCGLPGCSGYPNAFRGLENNYVALLQNCLNRLGYKPGSVDSMFGPNTESALRRFQRDLYLTEDGVATPKIWASLIPLGYGLRAGPGTE
mgnify:CR=1 FL=1